MKMHSFIAFAAALFLAACPPARAQWQVPDHSVPIGNGGAVTGFGSAAPGAIGGVLTSNGPNIDPTFQVTTPGSTPQGRVTLISGDPYMTSGDAVSVQNLYLAPVPEGAGALPSAPIYNGSGVVQYPIAASLTDQVGTLSLALAGSASWPAGTTHDLFLTLCGGVPCLGSRPWDSAMLPTAPAQITNNTTVTTGSTNAWTTPANAFNGTVHQNTANSAIITTTNDLNNCLGQDFGVGNAFMFGSIVLTGPTDNNLFGLNTFLTTYTYASVDGVNWTVIDSRNLDVSAINTQYAIVLNQTGMVPYRFVRQCYQGDGFARVFVSQMQVFPPTIAPATRRLVSYGGMPVNDSAIASLRTGPSTTMTVPQYQATYLGSFTIDAGSAGRVTAHLNPGPARAYNLWNYYHQRDLAMRVTVPTFVTSSVGQQTYTLTSIFYANMNNSASFSMALLIGYAINPVEVELRRAVTFQTLSASASYIGGIALDTLNNMQGNWIGLDNDVASQLHTVQGTAGLTLAPYFGSHTFIGAEYKEAPVTSNLIIIGTPSYSRFVARWRG